MDTEGLVLKAKGYTIDVGHDIPQVSPVRSYCKHATGGFRSCATFGEGEIPRPIWNGEDGPAAPYPGGNGIRFERAEGFGTGA